MEIVSLGEIFRVSLLLPLCFLQGPLGTRGAHAALWQGAGLRDAASHGPCCGMADLAWSLAPDVGSAGWEAVHPFWSVCGSRQQSLLKPVISPLSLAVRFLCPTSWTSVDPLIPTLLGAPNHARGHLYLVWPLTVALGTFFEMVSVIIC